MKSDADVICQQVNCKNVMGAGLAKAIYTKWPIVKRLYHEFCSEFDSPYDLLGKVQIIRQPEIPFDIANIFGQLNFGRKPVRYTDYNALIAAFAEIHSKYGEDNIIAFPYGIGCGLGGGDWDTVLSIIKECFYDRTIRIYHKQ